MTCDKKPGKSLVKKTLLKWTDSEGRTYRLISKTWRPNITRAYHVEKFDGTHWINRCTLAGNIINDRWIDSLVDAIRSEARTTTLNPEKSFEEADLVPAFRRRRVEAI